MGALWLVKFGVMSLGLFFALFSLASAGLVGVGLYNTSTSCPSSCDCPHDDYNSASLLLFQLNTAGELGFLASLKVPHLFAINAPQVGLNVSWAVMHPSMSVVYALSEVNCFQGNKTGSISAWVKSTCVSLSHFF